MLLTLLNYKILCRVLCKATVNELNLQCTLIVIGILDYLCVNILIFNCVHNESIYKYETHVSLTFSNPEVVAALQSSKTDSQGHRFKSRLGHNIIIPFLGDDE